MLQIGISAELQQKTLKAAQRYLSGKDVTPTIFDEAQFAVFKDLLYYWAGFRRSYQPPADPTRVPSEYFLLNNIAGRAFWYLLSDAQIFMYQL